jgi:hypothetical protein
MAGGIDANKTDAEVAARGEIPLAIPYVENVAFTPDQFNRCPHDVGSPRRGVASDEWYAVDVHASRPQLGYRSVTPAASRDSDGNPT